jgi:hypothetical protein
LIVKCSVPFAVCSYSSVSRTFLPWTPFGGAAMAVRSKIASTLVEWVGREALELVSPGTGWPSHFRARSTSDWIPVAAYIGPIGHSQRGRDDVERRFQNPGKNRPIVEIPGELGLLLGLYEGDGTHLLVGMDVEKRLGRETRQSLFMPLHLLRSADAWGWAEHFSDAGEKLIAFHPRLLPIYIELRKSAVDVPSRHLEELLHASGAGHVESAPEALERAISSVSRLVRDAVFSRDVCAAYHGRCAMCGLDFSLIEGAHIYPVAAPGSEDEVWNGLALCRNHHAAFDSHILYVEPITGRVRLHPELIRENTAGCKAFVTATFDVLAPPRIRSQRPRPEMFEKRYEFFKPKYSWL